ncbi:MAG TPA: 3-dehydroquinate synthase, partial [Longimicrobiales bacterium]|nr:3-dehydroquinate synthase [Longimicrobiales bacterium]
IGAFHQPAVVVIDPLVLETLPDDELRNGLAEAIKHGAIADAAYLATIPQFRDAISQRDLAALHALIKRSVEIKARRVSEDVHEAGGRAALNFGHTIGHALEHVSHFALPHGSAVALGMIAEAVAGELIGITEQGTAEQLKRVIGAVGLPLSVEMEGAAVIDATRSDKKTRAATQRYSLIARLGTTARTAAGEWTTPLPDDVVREGIKSILV